MPRNPGTGIYTKPYPDVISDTTMESTVHNGEIADIETDLNTPRPIVAGGTGANNATQARDNLDAEVAAQTVTNYDTHVWESGSFWSQTSATGGPAPGQVVTGFAVVAAGSPDWITLLAIDHNTGNTFIRIKAAGVWGAWSQRAGSIVEADARYVNTTGDTMTGNLVLSKSGPSLIIDTLGTTNGDLVFSKNSVNRWLLRYYGGDDVTGDLLLFRCDDVGNAALSFIISRSTGKITFKGGVQVDSDIAAARNATQGVYSFGTDVSKNLFFDGTKFSFNGGGLSITNGGANITGDTIIVGNVTGDSFTASQYIAVKANDARYYLNDASGVAKGILWYAGGANNDIQLYNMTYSLKLNSSGVVDVGTGMKCRTGQSGVFRANCFNIDWTDSVPQLWIDGSNLGTFAFTSDYRVKKDITDLPSTWETVKALRPIKYTQADYTPLPVASAPPDPAPELPPEMREPRTRPAPSPVMSPGMFKADNIERWGFIAHELQATTIESAATGVKDAPNVIQSPNPWTVIAALTKALQEAMTRIEALEAAQAIP